jgi:hypothetical protein
MSTENIGKGVMVDSSSGGPGRSLTGRTMPRSQALGLAGGALAGFAALASIPKSAGAAGVERSSAVLKSSGDVPSSLTYYGQGTFGRLFPQLPAFATNSPSVRGALPKLGKRGGLMAACLLSSRNFDKCSRTSPFGGCAFSRPWSTLRLLRKAERGHSSLHSTKQGAVEQ